ncbi:hypothetical protein JKF63_06882 [Porcisia hertigi]|uniref:Uncharacterized protein n=1 Tax=Porcisia hertigi TaxID=2761500 RepID=A0A837A990_9TRYP|nr:hypothetical protein JKF63_06882 [Porcisia hertigi]
MYSFNLTSSRKTAVGDSTELGPPAVKHVIRAPSELPPPEPSPRDESGVSGSDNNNSKDDDGGGGCDDVVPIISHARTDQHPVHVHNLASYTLLREAADWHVEVLREREEKKQRALAQLEATKLEEQRHRDAQEEKTKKEMQRRRLEREKERAEAREAQEISNFQDSSTQLLQNQLWLMELGKSVTQVDAQRRAHVREQLYKNSSSRKQLSGSHASVSSWPSTNVSGYHVSAPSTENDLRRAAEATEEAYVRLSLSYRSRAQRSSTAAAILEPDDITSKGRSRPQAATRTTTALTSSTAPSETFQTATGTLSPSPAALTQTAATDPVPFRPKQPMFTHTSTENMGKHANAIPYTYIPEYFDSSSTTATVAKVDSPRRAGKPHSKHQTDAVMPLPLSPTPVSRDVSGLLQAKYYPWSIYSNAALCESMLPLSPPPREASLPVRRWGKRELRDTMFGHCIRPDGTIEDQCERKKQFAAYIGYTTLPRDNATATSNNPVEPQVPLHFSKRMDVWL